MAYIIKWSPEAVEDLEAIYNFIARDSVYYAKSVIRKILDSVQNLQFFPKIGRIVPEVNKYEIRERLVYNYRVIYQIKEQTIIVLAIVHSSRLLEKFYERLNR
ncbi:type II toxin-antitoxin system RelE/ParE family toxin [Thermodesulfatator autotrophicus]|uniref:Plasmid stabilization protein n=1 Tax=Thermodesulfatator autotrophicus TaxID=1795632 RepID=A0A177E6R6_9BACT|nr:type II toxin-antitoxin system RelE/ParE family toxin [Thermodesulfatator autotrophicus]OAG26709.1 plasmid stabilization protein [Thermodesulfatator autotrophicus]